MAKSSHTLIFTAKDGTPYILAMLPPPGSIVAPDGFPANPRPANAPQLFLDAMDVRIRVFCDEQNCALEAELDEDDPRSWHWVAYQQPRNGGSQSPKPVSVIRIVPPPHAAHPNGFEDPNEEPYCKLGRVATLKEARGQGLSRALVDAACKWLAAHAREVGEGWQGNLLAHAQLEVEKMYERQQFVTDETLGRWDEEGIVHVGMWRRVKLQAKS
jgi:predicted GNAT family N-acyltransferase